MNRLWSLLKFSLVGGLLIAMSGCATMKNSAQSVARSLGLIEHVDLRAPLPKDTPPAYKSGIEALREGENQEALDILDKFLRDQPTSRWTQSAQLNAGRALQGLQRWAEAADRFHGVIATSINAPSLQAMALYHLSFSQEALGDDQDTVAVLVDLKARARYLPVEVRMAELPARLAAAYARVGNFDRAVEYYRDAESGIERLRSQSRKQKSENVPDWLGKTLYYMGHISVDQVDWSNFEIALRPLARSQVYLLQTAELAQEPWASRAVDELEKTYSHLWNVIATAPTSEDGEPVLNQRQRLADQSDRAAALNDTLESLKAREIPDKKIFSAEALKNIAAIDLMIGEMDRKISDLMVERPAGEGARADAGKRGKSAPLKVIEPDTSLEKKFLESSEAAPQMNLPTAPSVTEEPVEKTSPPTESTESTNSTDAVPIHSTGDPNL